jgi:glycosyltransferase involved in cell wall biosynthesis
MDIVSVLVCTRNRPQSLARAVRSLLSSEHVNFELIVVDQSDGAESRQALAVLVADPRLNVLCSPARGKGAALNEGVQMARGDIIVCTDDDCEASPDWVAGMSRTLEERPGVAVAFCNVVSGDHDSSAGYIPTFVRREDRLLSSIDAVRGGLGLGAGMAVRRSVVLALGGFDEAFGPGARFASGDEWDLAQRALLGGWQVYQTAQLSILHHGFLRFAEGGRHTRRDWTSTGAGAAKMLRAGRFHAATIPLWTFCVYGLWPPLFDLLRLRRPRQLARTVGFIQGFFSGVRTPVDRRTLIYQAKGAG